VHKLGWIKRELGHSFSKYSALGLENIGGGAGAAGIFAVEKFSAQINRTSLSRIIPKRFKTEPAISWANKTMSSPVAL
jgi:hypothetical protein